MKYLIKNIRILFMLLGITAIFSGCNKEPEIKIYTYPVPVPTGITSTSGYPGTYMYINGSSFGTYTNAVSVSFGGVKADSIISCTDTQIKVKVPVTAITGKVTLKIWTHIIDSVGLYTVLPVPVIKSVTSGGSLGAGIAAEGDVVTIMGGGFGSDLSKVSVSFNGTNATAISLLTDTKIQVTTPKGYASGNVIVSVNGFPTVGGALLNPDVKGDITVFYIKNYKKPFINVASTVAGTGTGRWGIPADWTVTSPWLNQLNSGGTAYCGGWDYNPDPSKVVGYLAMQGGWGSGVSNSITNGKMYQTTTLPAGNYTFSIDVQSSAIASGGNVYLTIAAGNALPDFTDVPTKSLAYASFSTKLVSFTLTQKTQVSIGFVATVVPNSYFELNYVKITSL